MTTSGWPFPTGRPSSAPQSATPAYTPEYNAFADKWGNAATGETWSGRGLQPMWLKVAIAEGGKLSDFVVGGAAA